VWLAQQQPLGRICTVLFPQRLVVLAALNILLISQMAHQLHWQTFKRLSHSKELA
jgi:hypothetical protein